MKDVKPHFILALMHLMVITLLLKMSHKTRIEYTLIFDKFPFFKY